MLCVYNNVQVKFAFQVVHILTHVKRSQHMVVILTPLKKYGQYSVDYIGYIATFFMQGS
jgi:hypothetical protein